MTLYLFLALDEMEQAEAVWNGTLLGDRQEGEYKILLYAVDNFYVEVFYHSIHNVIRKFRPFKETTLLKPYLNQIDIRNLL